MLSVRLAARVRSCVHDLKFGSWSKRSRRSTRRMVGAAPRRNRSLVGTPGLVPRKLRGEGRAGGHVCGADDAGIVNPLTKRRLVVVDFDDTCTVGDTISHLVSATKSLQPAHVLEEKDRTYQELFRQYMEERNELVDRLFRVKDMASCTSAAGLSEDQDDECPRRAWLDMFLHELSCFETRRNDVVLASGILHGATMESIARASQNVVFREACLETLHSASVAAGTSVVVLSANWSEEFIRAALSNHHGACGGFDTGKVEVVANALEFDAGITTGGMRIRQCQTPNDKHRLLRALVFDERGQNVEHPSVFVGDSVGDVPALLAASLGIVMGRNSLLERVLVRGGVQIRNIDEFRDWSGGAPDWGTGAARAGRGRVVWQTTSWEAVKCALGLN